MCMNNKNMVVSLQQFSLHTPPQWQPDTAIAGMANALWVFDKEEQETVVVCMMMMAYYTPFGINI